jgi:hypothetical protein
MLTLGALKSELDRLADEVVGMAQALMPEKWRHAEPR